MYLILPPRNFQPNYKGKPVPNVSSSICNPNNSAHAKFPNATSSIGEPYTPWHISLRLLMCLPKSSEMWLGLRSGLVIHLRRTRCPLRVVVDVVFALDLRFRHWILRCCVQNIYIYTTHYTIIVCAALCASEA